MRILITAGPTREFLDDVRFLSNPSTGGIGFACAKAAKSAGHSVMLVTGPTPLEAPAGVKVIRVVSAQEMHDAAMNAFSACDAVIAAAAVSDYRPAHRRPGKVKKGDALMTVALVKTPDILAEMGRTKGRRTLIGFALETGDRMKNGREKLKKKHLDHIIINGPDAFGAELVDATILHADDTSEEIRGVSKERLAKRIVSLLG